MEYHDKSRENEEKENKAIPLKFLCGNFWLRKLQGGLEKGTHLTWTTQEALHKLIHATRKLCFDSLNINALVDFRVKE